MYQVSTLGWFGCNIALAQYVMLNLSSMATSGTDKSGCCREVAAVVRFKQESVHGLSTKTVANSGGLTVYLYSYCMQYIQ